MSDITARQIIGLLEARAHSNQHVFFDEVSNYGQLHTRRIDAIAIKPAYSKVQVWGYEVKVSRNDFIRDDKWHAYMDMCNNLYFVSPHGVIAKEEVPAEAGLIHVFKNGKGMRIVKKAPYRTVDYGYKYFLGMILNKCGVIEENDRPARIKQAMRIAALNEDAVSIGMNLGSGLAKELYKQNIRQAEQAELLFELQEVKEYLEAEGLTVVARRKTRYGHTSLKERLQHQEHAVLRNSSLDVLAANVRQTMDNLGRFADRLDKAQDNLTPKEQG